MNSSIAFTQNEASLLEFFQPYTTGASWVNKCALQVIQSLTDPISSVSFVDKHGLLTNNTTLIRGVTLATCVTHCSRRTLPLQFNFETFSSGVTNFFLPWLFLTAQLPFETGLPDKNLTSFYLAVGSPVLITFSLFITALNGHWIHRRFELLSESQVHFLHFQRAVCAARDFLRGSQQSPIRINRAAFTALFRCPDEGFSSWWSALTFRLERTTKPFTFPLGAQGLFAVIVWVLTIAYNFATNLGNPSSALLLSSGTLWLWLVPVVVGWVFVSTQYMESGVKHALLEYTEGGFRPSSEVGLEARSGLTAGEGGERGREVPNVLWSDVQGDEKVQGPAFNYARCMTTPQLAESVAQAFEYKLSHLRKYSVLRSSDGNGRFLHILEDDHRHGTVSARTVSATTEVAANDEASTREPPPRLRSRSSSTAIDPLTIITRTEDNDAGAPAYPKSGLFETSPKAYVEWTDMNSAWKKNILVANILALFLQWGVTGAAVLIAYNTPARGIGCRSSSYLLYAILATTAHFLLLASVLLSHDAMLIHQRFAQTPINSSHQARLKVVSILAVLMRITGKVLAAANTCWIILSSIFEMIGLYNSCFCEGSMLLPNKDAWVLLFRNDAELRTEAQGYWAGGVVMSAIVCFVTFLVVFMYSNRR